MAEMLKAGSTLLLNVILEVFNDILLLRGAPPQAWKHTKLTVIFKKGDPQLPHRPIAIVPILYKVFSRMFCSRMMKHIMQHQDVDQAAYRKGFSTEDHLLTVSLIIEKSWEYNFPIWLALVDFEKAFDTVEHEALWKVLEAQSVPSHYIKILKSSYTCQLAAVKARERSRV
jgi:hypothetical protein